MRCLRDGSDNEGLYKKCTDKKSWVKKNNIRVYSKTVQSAGYYEENEQESACENRMGRQSAVKEKGRGRPIEDWNNAIARLIMSRAKTVNEAV